MGLLIRDNSGNGNNVEKISGILVTMDHFLTILVRMDQIKTYPQSIRNAIEPICS